MRKDESKLPLFLLPPIFHYQYCSLGLRPFTLTTPETFLPQVFSWKLFSVTLGQFSSFTCSVMSASVTSWTAACQKPLPITNSQSLLKLMSIESIMPSYHLILCHPLLLLLPSIFPSIRVFANESAHVRWPKYWKWSAGRTQTWMATVCHPA